MTGALNCPEAQAKAPAAYSPATGSAERREILDAMRRKVKELHRFDVIFTVKAMKVSDGWAWVHTLPRSKDGISAYEDFYALLHRTHGRWSVAEIPCTEPENPECIDSPGYFRKLAARFPGLPASIFPVESKSR
ncbi:MAG: hypothetical protein HGB22_08185 [Chlorobiaceae bacterium]|nr:hypothetical protein [Chlorobiaceae bacterium]